MNKNKIIFLDIDGVLNNPYEIFGEMGIPLNEDKLKILEEIIEKTDSHVVITSSWRLGKSIGILRREFKQSGFLYPKNIIGKTPIHSDSNRSNEIKQYIKKYSIDNYVVIDDKKLSVDNFYKTKSHNGLTQKIAVKIINNLNKND